MALPSVLQCLGTLACLVLATRGSAPQSYSSINTVVLNRGSAQQLPEQCTAVCEDINGDPLESVHIRDPSSCQQYWICLPNGTRYEQPHVCPAEEIVNIDKLVCEPIINDGSGQCTIPDPECDPSIPKVCYHEDTCPPPEDGIFPYVKKDDACNIYHICHFADVEITCADETPYFNGQECVNDTKQCCECQAVCSETWTFIPDPLDCHSYYLCQGLDGPVSGCLSSMECVAEGYFPRCTNVCDPGFFYCSNDSVSQQQTVEAQFCMLNMVFHPQMLRCVPSKHCNTIGYIATEEEKFTCPNSDVFVASTGNCNSTETCVTKCL